MAAQNSLQIHSNWIGGEERNASRPIKYEKPVHHLIVGAVAEEEKRRHPTVSTGLFFTEAKDGGRPTCRGRLHLLCIQDRHTKAATRRCSFELYAILYADCNNALITRCNLDHSCQHLSQVLLLKDQASIARSSGGEPPVQLVRTNCINLKSTRIISPTSLLYSSHNDQIEIGITTFV